MYVSSHELDFDILTRAGSSDSFLGGRRWPPVLVGAVSNIICYTSLAVWDIPVGWKWTVFIMSGAGFGLSGLLMAYVLAFLFTPLFLEDRD